MALKIRLTRLGDKGNPFYRVVVAESRSSRDGKFVEILGTYDPRAKDDASAIKINREIATSWIAKGAQPTDTARTVLKRAGVITEDKVISKSKPTAKPVAKKKKGE